jgi:N-acetylmuramic acid 6-phosphate (MurNAc-6-P) etherase
MEAGVSYEEASRILEEAKYDVVTAIVMAVAGVSYDEAVRLLQQTGYIPTRAVELAKRLRGTVS